jgi:hypothetical protein
VKVFRRFRDAILSGILLALLALPSTVAAAPTGPVYPVPNTATARHGGNVCAATGSLAVPTGVTWTFGGGTPTNNMTCPPGPAPSTPFDTNLFQNLYWGSHGGAGKRPFVSMDQGPDIPSETLTLRAGETNLAQGLVIWGGVTHMPACNPCSGSFTNFTVDTKVELRITDLAGAHVALLTPAQAGIANPEVGGVVSITPALRNFRANIRIRARIGADEFEPAEVLFNRYHHPNVAGLLRTSFTGAFWYENRKPLADFTFTDHHKADTPITFDASVSDADGIVAGLGWDFNNDGEFQESDRPARSGASRRAPTP